MIQVYCPNISNTSIGGGWTFLRNLTRASKSADSQFSLTSNIKKSEVLFAFSPSTIDGETIKKFKNMGKPFVLRIDGVPEDSRNSGKGTRRLVEYAKLADHIVYQTNFVNMTVGRVLRALDVKADSSIVMNGVDTDVFKPEGPKIPLGGPNTFNILHVNYRKDPNKRVEEVIAMYRELWTYRHDVNLVLLGRYPSMWQDYNMGFFAGERFQRIGVTTDDTYKAMVMRSCDLFYYPSFADPSPNVVMEAMASGLPIACANYGGASEIAGISALHISPLSIRNFIDLQSESEKVLGDQMRQIILNVYTLTHLAKSYSSLFMKVAR